MTLFSNPWAFTLLLIIPVVLLLLRFKSKATVRFSSSKFFMNCSPGWRVRLRPLLLILRIICIILIVISIARPRKGTKLSNVSTEGVAMQIVVDRSGSMDEQMAYKGRQLTRFEVVKNVLEDFIKGDGDKLKGRAGDMIGLVTFARYPDTTCPLVHSHGILLDFMKQTETVSEKSEENATAIGEAISLAAARLEKAEQQILDNNRKIANSSLKDKSKPDFDIKSKVLILLTDGINNAGEMTPMQAAELASEWGIKIYAIGIGSDGYRSFGGMRIPMRSQLDEAMLQSIAQKTGGFYARADSAESLKKIYEKIDELEDTKIEAVDYYEYAEKFELFTFAALIVLLCEIVLSCTLLRKIP
ncbi:MAG: VWA domain-containing protein [Sedimentisphaeraceae bacterium JB056]